MASMSYYVSPSSYHVVQLNISLLAKSTPHLLLNHSQRIKYSKILSPLVKSSTHTQCTTSMLIHHNNQNNYQLTIPIANYQTSEPSEVEVWNNPFFSQFLQSPPFVIVMQMKAILMIMVLDREVVPPPWKFD